MKRIQPVHLLAFIIVLFGAATAVLAVEAAQERRRMERAEEFQRLVGGLGVGPALYLSRDPFRFDPRLADRSTADDGPLAGGARFDPHRAGSIFSYPPLNREKSVAPPRE